MAQLSPIAALAQASLFLKNSAPREYEQFLDALRNYGGHVTAAVVQARSDEILVAQGNAQMVTKIVQTLAECDKPKPTRPTP